MKNSESFIHDSQTFTKDEIGTLYNPNAVDIPCFKIRLKIFKTTVCTAESNNSLRVVCK